MTLNDAIARALTLSNSPDYRGCSVHVSGRIRITGEFPLTLPTIDPQAWSVSDWYSEGGTVFTYVNGQLRG